MLKSNYHTHTFRCGHASGLDEEYVVEALGEGITELGFSDHIMLPGFSDPGIRGEYSQFEGYITSINNLKAKYKDRMNILLGFEAESFQVFFPYYKELIDTGVIDYLILGNHCQMNESKKITEYFGKISSASELYRYRDLAISALQTGVFSCFAHPDYFMSSIEKPDKDCINVMRELIQASMALAVPLEVNIAGIRNGIKKIGKIDRWIYPTSEFFSIASEMGADCILGIDAHAPQQISDEDANEKAIMFSRNLGLHLLEKLEIK
jgi:histidinol-phosphatase (PHP family)